MDSYYFSKAVFKMLKVIHRPEMKWTLNLKFPTIFFQPHMKRSEYFMFKRLCRNNKTFLEYGSGGSTILLLKKKKIVFSVESNPQFYKDMVSMNFVRKAEGSDLHYSFVNLGPTNQWGKPLTDEFNENWPRYYEQVWEEIDPAKYKIDVVFIDGRFRVSCCLFSILKAIEYNWTDIVFVIHDFWGRSRYHVVLDFLQETSSVESLVFFRMKNNIPVSQVKAVLAEYAMVVA